jgi:hypothetical protein
VLDEEPHEPLRSGRVVTRSRRPETRAEHLARHQADVRAGRADERLRARILGVAA